MHGTARYEADGNMSPPANTLPERVVRFDRVQRATHWCTAALFSVLAFTGAALYVPALGGALGHRLVVEDIHIYTGVAIIIPLAVAVCGPWGRAMRRDLASMDRFSRGEILWLRTRGRQGRAYVGKFNPGQKLNTFAIAGLLSVMLVTGLILRWGNFLPVAYRTSATFVHDWFAFGIVALVLAHVMMAMSHPAALRSMVVGWVTRSWAARHAPAWELPPAPGVTVRNPSPSAKPGEQVVLEVHRTGVPAKNESFTRHGNIEDVRRQLG